MGMQMTTGKKQFIKVESRDLAEMLIALGFSYIMEGEVFVFPESDRLLAVLQRQYEGEQTVRENKLRF